MFDASWLRIVNRPVPLTLRRLAKWGLGWPVGLLTGFRVDGAERLPRRRRRLIIACNHAAFIDSVYLIFAVRPRFTVCGAKPRLFRSLPLRALMAFANILRVDDHEQFLADCGRLLATDEILLIYPEMGRYPDGLGEFREWAAEVALAAEAPILPCYLYGTTKGQSGAPRLIVGEEMSPGGDAAELTETLRKAITSLIPANRENSR